MNKQIYLLISIFFIITNLLYATPSTQIWNPSTDIQELHKWHIGIDDYFSVNSNYFSSGNNNIHTQPNQSSTDINITYGLFKHLEVGIDIFQPRPDPLQLNIKYGFPERANIPAFALGIQNIGFYTENSNSRFANNYDIAYALLAKTFRQLPRLSIGYYMGNSTLLVDENNQAANTGIILTIDKQITDKLWAAIDYSSGQSWYGQTSFGVSYSFSPNMSIIFGYVIYNNNNPKLTTPVINTTNNQFTTQLDINF